MSAPHPHEAYPQPIDEEVQAMPSDPPRGLVLLLDDLFDSVATHPASPPVESVDHGERVRTLLDLEDNWNGYDSPAPNEESGDLARAIVSACEDVGLSPDRIVPDAEGGISIYFFSADRIEGGASRRRGCIQIGNDGYVEGFLDDRSDPNVREFFDFNAYEPKEAEEAVSRIQAFIAD